MTRKNLSGIILRVVKVLESLSDRDQVILKSRFGMDGEILTLANLGERYNVTRERIRQIQDYALSKFNRIASCNDKLFYTNADFETYILKNGGLVSCERFEDYLLDYGFSKEDFPYMYILIASSPSFKLESNKVLYKPSILLAKLRFTEVTSLLNEMYKDLKKSLEVQNLDKFVKKFKSKIELVGRISALNIDRRFCIKDNCLSLVEWRHVNPKTLADKINFVLDKVNSPIHFREICSLILEHKFDFKKISENAVHNELINNDDFVLVGRGVYARSDWGYERGTVSEIISQILEEKGPMHIYDIKREVLQRRKVKEVTVQVNLNSCKDKFRKNSETGKYELV